MRPASPAPGRARTSISALADVTEQVFGSPNTFPGRASARFFPSITREERERLRQARLARDPSQPAQSHTANEAQSVLPAALPAGERSEAEEEAIRALQAGVGAGGSGGTKRSFRDVDRTSWDAASELVRLERERVSPRSRVASGGDERDARAVPANGGQSPYPLDREKTPTPGMAFAAANEAPSAWRKGKERDIDAHPRPDHPAWTERRGSTFTQSDASDAEDSMAVDADDDASIVTGETGASAGGNGSDASGNEPAKKRSRTLTTPAQTAVLNALLAKVRHSLRRRPLQALTLRNAQTRFPSTETREEVGKQIGMSARRVQIWFQNRRQSQKRQREREAQEELAAARAARAMMSAQAQHMIGYPLRVHPAYEPAHGGYVQAAHFYPPLQPKPVSTDYVLADGHAAPPGYHLMPASSVDERMYGVPGSNYAPIALPVQPGDPRYAPSYGMAARSSRLTYEQPQRRPSQGDLPAHYASGGRAPGLPTSQVYPSKLYFPHVPRAVPAGYRPAAQSYAAPAPAPSSSLPPPIPMPSAASAGPSPNGASPEFRLPPIAAVFDRNTQAELPDPRAYRPRAPSVSPGGGERSVFSHSPFPLSGGAEGGQRRDRRDSRDVPQAHEQAHEQAQPRAQAQGPARAVFSPEPASSFERLRISGDGARPSAAFPRGGAAGRVSPDGSASERRSGGDWSRRPPSMDVLDMAVDAMSDQSSRALPARHVLPPLRAVFGESSFAKEQNDSRRSSEADQALTRPIRPPGAPRSDSSSSALGGQRLPSLAHLAPGSPMSHAGSLPPGAGAGSHPELPALTPATSFHSARSVQSGSDRRSHEYDRTDAVGSALSSSHSNSTISPRKPASVGDATSVDEEADSFWRDRGDSVGTAETSLGSTDAHAGVMGK